MFFYNFNLFIIRSFLWVFIAFSIEFLKRSLLLFWYTVMAFYGVFIPNEKKNAVIEEGKHSTVSKQVIRNAHWPQITQIKTNRDKILFLNRLSCFVVRSVQSISLYLYISLCCIANSNHTLYCCDFIRYMYMYSCTHSLCWFVNLRVWTLTQISLHCVWYTYTVQWCNVNSNFVVWQFSTTAISPIRTLTLTLHSHYYVRQHHRIVES